MAKRDDIDTAPDADEEPLKPLSRKLPMWPWLVGLVVAIGAFWLYSQSEQRGPRVLGPGHVLLLPGDDRAWLFFLEGSVGRATAEDTQRLGLRTGPCDNLEASIELELNALAVQKAECTPGGPLQKTIGERLKRAGMRFGYFAEGIAPTGQTLEPVLQTPELYGAIVDPRAELPQVQPLYFELTPGLYAANRTQHGPPPTVIAIKRNDLLIRRFTRSQMAWFLDLPRFFFAGGAVQGGWLVREVLVRPDGAQSLEALLVNPEAPPFDTLLKSDPVVVARRTSVRETPDVGVSTDAGAVPPSPDAGP